MLETILNKVRKLNMGKSLNKIQDVAERILTKRRWRQYLIDANKDVDKCKGMDGLFINGEYFDWKEFEWNKDAIIMAYLRYFTDEEIMQISMAL